VLLSAPDGPLFATVTGLRKWVPWLIFAAFAAVALVAFVAVELRHPHPLLDLRLFRAVTFSAVMFCVLASSVAFSCLVFTSVWLQSVLGLSPVRSGLAMVPMALATFVVSTLAGRLLHGISPRLSVGGGLLLSGLGCGLQAHLDAGSGAASITLGLAVTGVGVGLIVPAMGAAVMSAAPDGRQGMAAGAMTTFRQLGQTLGVAVLGVVFQHGLGAHTALNSTRPVRDAAAHGLNLAYGTAAVLGFAAGLLALVVIRKPATPPGPPPGAPAPAPQGAETR
jgi:MFS family permease